MIINNSNKSFEELRKEFDLNKIKTNKNLEFINTDINNITDPTPDSNIDIIEFDKCVKCNKPSPYPLEIPYDQRHCYINGIGQLCIDCCKKLNERKFV